MKKRLKSISGYLLFFGTIAATVTIVLIVYELVNEQSKSIISISMLAAILAIALLCTIADFIRRKIMIDKPLNEILSATKKIASGDFSARLTPEHSYETYDEFDKIKENLNAMAAELEKSEVLKTDFISNVSHEIKTPVAVIKSYSSLLESESDPERRHAYAKQISLASSRLSDLVSNILRLNKLENQQLLIEKKTLRLDKMLEDSILSFERTIEEKGLELECDLNEVIVHSSRSYLELVWNNLISNAVKFTEPGGKIYVSCKWIDGSPVVEIGDTGCGINAETGKHIFDKFYQGETSHAGEGNGLGLALVKRVIDLIGAEISVKSELGKGTTFSVTLP